MQTYRELRYSIYKELKKVNSKANNPVKKWAQGMSRPFAKDEKFKCPTDIWKKITGSPATREMRVKTRMSFTLPYLKGYHKNHKTINAGEDVRKRGP